MREVMEEYPRKRKAKNKAEPQSAIAATPGCQSPLSSCLVRNAEIRNRTMNAAPMAMGVQVARPSK